METGKPVGFLQERPCWKPICEVVAPCQSEAAAPAAPVKTPEKKPTLQKPVKAMASYTEKELCEELAARGWVVTLRLK